MAQVTAGLKLSGAPALHDVLATGSAYAKRLAQLSGQSGRVIKLGAWVGSNGTQPTNLRMGLYTDNAPAGSPLALMGNTDVGVISWDWVGGSGGQNLELPITTVLTGYGSSQAGIVVRDGVIYDIAVMHNEDVRHGYVVAAGKTVPTRTLAGTTLPNPFAATIIDGANRDYAWYAVIEQNRAPVITNVSEGSDDGHYLGTLTPTFSFRFTDADRTAGYNDYPTKAIIRIYEVVNGANVYLGAYTKTLTNPGAGTSYVDVSFAYAGPALSWDKTYRYTLEVQDEVADASGTTIVGGTTSAPDGTLYFTTSQYGIISSTGPTGKQTTLTPGPFTGTYNHPSGLALDRVTLRLLKRNNLGVYVVDQTSAEIDIANVPDDGVVSVSWATAGFLILAWGQDYAVEWKTRDIAVNISDWHGRGYFTTNKIPQQALISNIENGAIYNNTNPELWFSVVDEDDTGGGALDGQVEISGPYFPTNATFDTNLTGWTYSESGAWTETFTRDTGAPYAGAGNARVSISAAPANTTSYWQIVNDGDKQRAHEGYTYGFSAYVKRSNSTPEIAAVIRWFDASAVFLSESVGPYIQPTTGEYRQIAYADTAPANTRYFSMALRVRNKDSFPVVPYTVDADSFAARDGVKFIKDAVYENDDAFSLAASEFTTSLTGYGYYTVRARGKDASNAGAWSAPVMFGYFTGPSGSITSPTDGQSFSTDSVTITWTVSGLGPQVRYKINVLDVDTGDELYDSGWIVSASTSHTIPPGYLGTGDVTANLWIDNGLLNGIAAIRNFTTSYAAPAAPGNFQANAYRHPTDPEPSSVILTWDAITTAPENIIYLLLEADEGEGWKRIARFDGAIAAGVSSFIYPFPRPNRDVQYRIKSLIRAAGGASQSSLYATASFELDLTHISLVSVTNPMSRRVPILYWDTLTENATQNQAFVVPAGGLDYVEVPGSLRGRDISFNARFIDRQDGSGFTAEFDKTALTNLYDGQLTTDGRRINDILCFRDPRGQKHFVRFNGNPNVSHLKGNVRYEANVALRRVAYTEG